MTQLAAVVAVATTRFGIATRLPFTTRRAFAQTTAALAAVLNRRGLRVRIRFEARADHFLRNWPLDEAFDIAQQLMLTHAHERHRFAFRAHAPRAADAMHIIFQHIRQIEIDHMRQLIDIDTASVASRAR